MYVRRFSFRPISAFVLGVGLNAMGTGSSLALTFTDVGVSSGISFQHLKDPDADPADPTVIMGAGGAWLDYNNDDLPDLYETQGDGCNYLFENNGDGTFTDVTTAAGVGACSDVSHGAAAADYDNDGDADLLVLNRGQNRLYQNNNDGTFDDVTVSAGLENPPSGLVWNANGASWGDVDGDGYLDVYIGNYLDYPDQGPPIKPCQRNLLFRNNGNGTFSEVAVAVNVAFSGVDVFGMQDGGCTLAVAMTDYDADGDPDIIVNNDFGVQGHPGNVLFRNDGPDGSGGWIFTDVTVATGMDFEMFGMGIGIGDIDNDTHLDYYFSNMTPDILAYNNGDDTFTDIAESAGVAEKFPEIYNFAGAISWGNGFGDFNLDGFDDIVVAHGGAPVDIPMFRDTIDAQPAFIYINNTDNTFTEKHVEVGMTDEQIGRGLALADYDNDGDMDVWIGNIEGFPVLWRNDRGAEADTDHWLKVKAVGTVGASDAIGARISPTMPDGVVLTREVGGGSSFNSMHSLEKLFGTGVFTEVDSLTVSFRSGLSYETRGVAVDQRLVVTEPIVTTDATPEVLSLNRGDPVELSCTVANHTDVAQTVQHWAERINPDGTVDATPPQSGTLGPNRSATFPKTYPTSASFPVGDYAYVFKIADSNGELIHQEYVDVTLN